VSAPPLRLRSALTALALVCGLAVHGCNRQPAPSSDGRVPAWLDVSPALGEPARDPADALAVLHAFGTGRLHVRGVSTTFGNAPLVRGFPAAQALLERLDSGRLRPWRGASSAEEREAPTEASELLTEALDEGPLTIVAAGPVTTIAAVLLRRPDLTARIERLVMLGGQAGDGPVRPDPHVAADPGSVRVLLERDLAITLVPVAAEAGLRLDAADVNRLEAGDPLLRIVAAEARGWLAPRATAGTPYLDAPALLAIDVAAHPGEIRCEAAMAALSTEAGPARLLVSGTPNAGGRRVTWCAAADAGAHDRIVRDLLALRSTK